jgi:hypothetical protein
LADAWYTVVTREPEWDEESRARALRLREYENGLCPRHGVPRSVCRDPEVQWVVHEDVDYAERQEKGFERLKAAPHENEKPDRAGRLWDDGRRFWARPYDPHRDPPVDEMLRRQRGGQVGNRPPPG